ncbi:MAG: hypothetical protein DMF73_12905 [Acidobacteria bacterium]|nr:MAG: hypothetical protein DMF73_12905 [Acidobacteriota bacterium]
MDVSQTKVCATLMINPTISEWLNFIARWIHVFAGIMWVGTTYYFTWLDARLTEEEKALLNTGKAAQIWMVHSGGFYVGGNCTGSNGKRARRG